MCGQLLADMVAALDWYDGEASAHIPDDARGRTLADSVRAAVIDHIDREKVAADQLAASLHGPLLTVPDGCEVKQEVLRAELTADPAVLVAELAATIVSGAVSGITGLEYLTDKHLGKAVDHAARLVELAKTKADSPPTPPPTDVAATYFAWFVGRGRRALYVERPEGMTDAQAGEARRVLLKRGWLAYAGGAGLMLADGGLAEAERLDRQPVLVNGGPHTAGAVKVGEQDDAA